MRLWAGIALVTVGMLLAGCGGSSRLSASDYRSRLAALGKEADKAPNLDKLGSAKTVAEMQATLKAFAAAQDRLADKVSSLKAPKDAEAANAELARGEHDSASEIRAVLPKLAKFTSPKAAFGFLSKLNSKGGQEQDDALAKLKKLGYTKGS